MYKSVFSKVLLGLTVLAFMSCDKDFNEIGSEIVGDDHFDFLTKFDVPIEANTVATGPVESRNLPVNPLGVLTDAKFGTTEASVVTQLELATVNPVINAALNPEVVNVVLTVPYFSTADGTDTEGNTLYVLDSIYGPTGGKIDLKVFRSGYYMRDINYTGESQEAQLFYTDEGPTFNSLKVGEQLNTSGAVSQNSEFVFSNSGYEVIETEDGEEEPTTTKFPPAMRLDLDIDVFQQAIIEAPAGSLANNNVFKNYFRGLYFQASKSGTNAGQLAMLNFGEGNIKIKYQQDQMVAGVMTRVDKIYTINLGGNTASLVENENSAAYNAGLDQAAGSNSRLWLKGGQGSVATIDLFGTEDADGNGVADALDLIREENWLINEANLTFFIDQTSMANSPEPIRLYLYDLTNRRAIADYAIDGTTAANPKLKKKIYSGIIQRVPATGDEEPEDRAGVKYKVRLTNYINSLIKNNDSTNVRLGLSITEDIETFSMVKLKNPNAALRNVIPTGSVMSPLGTVLYGSVGSDIPEGKRLKLEIYYTKPE